LSSNKITGDSFIIPACEKCSSKVFEKVERDIPMDVPDAGGKVLVKQVCHQCTNCGEIYLTYNQTLEFVDKIDKGVFRPFPW
jgi:predicted  nucleic acid-binding Zn-ribbon protein